MRKRIAIAISVIFTLVIFTPARINPQAAKTELPYYKLRTKLGMEGKSPDEIAVAVQAAYDSGGIPKRTGVSFAYMWSADQAPSETN